MTRFHLGVDSGFPKEILTDSMASSHQTPLRRLPLYPSELRARRNAFYGSFTTVANRAERWRWGELIESKHAIPARAHPSSSNIQTSMVRRVTPASSVVTVKASELSEVMIGVSSMSQWPQ
jgi:hypothetical protein